MNHSASGAAVALAERPATGSGSAGRSPAVVLAVLCGSQLMVALDSTIVNVALPSMRTALALSPDAMQWVVNGYTLSLAGLLLLGGRLADVFGRKAVFLTGLGLFTVASLLGGLAPSAALLITARVLQGVGAAILSPATMGLLTGAFPDPNARRRALGAWTAAGSSGGALGAVLGGLLTELLNWHWVLLVNVPVGVVLFAVARRCFATSATRSPARPGGLRRLDLPGTVAVSLGLVALVYAVVVTDTAPWGCPRNLAALGIGVAALVAFVIIELRSAHPLLPLGLFRLRAVACSNGLALLLGAGITAMFYFLSLYLQSVLGLSPVQAGLAFLPGSLGMFVGSMIGTRLLTVLRPRWLLCAAGLMAFLGVLWLSRMPVDGSFLGAVLAPVLVASLGVGMGFVPITTASIQGVDPEGVGVANGLMRTSQQVGSAVGLAVLATVAATTTGHLSRAAASPHAALVAMAGGYRVALLCAAVLVLVEIGVALAMPRLTTGSAKDLIPTTLTTTATS